MMMYVLADDYVPLNPERPMPTRTTVRGTKENCLERTRERALALLEEYVREGQVVIADHFYGIGEFSQYAIKYAGEPAFVELAYVNGEPAEVE